MSPLMAALASIRTQTQVQKWNFSLLINMARPPAAITSQEVLDEEQYQRLRIMIEEMYSGPGNAGRPLNLENGIDWKPLSLTPNEMNWQATSKLSASEIAMVLGVPGELIGANTTRAIGSTVQESRKAFYLETLLPMLDFIKSELNNWLSPLYPDHPELEYNKDEMEALQEALQQKWSMLLQAYGSGVLSLNEVRYALGYEDIPGGDTPMALLQLMQMGGVPAQAAGGQPLDALSSALISGVFSGAAPTNGQPAPQPQAQAAAGQPAMTAAPQQQQPGAPAPAPQQAAPAAGQPAQAAQPATTNAAAAPAQAAPGQQPTQAAPAEDMNSVPSIIKKLLGEENGAPEPTVSGKREKNEGLTDTQQPAQAAGQPAPQQPAANGGVNNAQ
jgi:hypothetical protein